MKELVSEQRLSLAQAISRNRFLEKEGLYKADRNLEEYLEDFNGLEATLDFARRNFRSNLVVDVGAGQGTAVSELSRSELGDRLKFLATVLKINPKILEKLGKNAVRVTSVERLRGIDNESVAGILGFNSIAYSAIPEVAMRRVDEVLAPGGIIKATFATHSRFFNFQLHDEFSAVLKEMGYDICVIQALGEEELSVLIGIKPGGSDQMSAKQVMDADRFSLEHAPLILSFPQSRQEEPSLISTD